jgi:ubiquitin-like-conjugating enzyme ATG3
MSKNIIHQTWSTWRDWITPVSHTSTFRATGKLTPEEFVLAGDYLVYKFPSWQWADASTPAQRVPFLPPGKQYLVTRGVPCHRRLNDNFAGDLQDDVIIQDMLRGGAVGGGDGDDEGWLRTGSGREYADSQEAKRKDVRTVDEAGNVNEREEEEEEIPDMEDDDDDEEAIIRDPAGGSATTA